MIREEPQHNTLQSTHKLLTKIIVKKNTQEKNHYSNIKTTQSNIRFLNRKPGRQESMGKYILRPENECVQTKITTSKNSYFVSSTENNISKFREHRGNAPEDV